VQKFDVIKLTAAREFSMPISWDSLNYAKPSLPPRVLIYGPPGIGKTSLAAGFPSPVFLQTEDGEPQSLDIKSLGLLSTYDDVMDGMSEIFSRQHDFRTLVIDSLDKFEPLLWQKVCEDGNQTSIEGFGYGKGYVEADKYWRDFITGLNQLRIKRKMFIVMVAHSAITYFPNPAGSEFPRWDIRLHKRALGIIQDEVDAILLLNYAAETKTEGQGTLKKHTTASSGSTRWIYADGRPAWVAKNRMDMPERLLCKKGCGFEALAPYFPQEFTQASAPAKPKPASAKRKETV
jgi:DNA polymerase III delta prime subunit